MEGTRAATPEDLAEVTRLAAEALAELEPTRGGSVFVVREARAVPLAVSLAAEIDHPGNRVVVGTIDGTVVGYAAAGTEELRDGRRLGVVSDLYVTPEARGVGVGEAMMDDLLGWLGEAGCHGVDATALPGNRATKNFFEASGFSARLIVMHHRLAAAPGPGAGAGSRG